jgi:hypothetical protein
MHLLADCCAGCAWLQQLPALPFQLEELACSKIGELQKAFRLAHSTTAH